MDTQDDRGLADGCVTPAQARAGISPQPPLAGGKRARAPAESGAREFAVNYQLARAARHGPVMAYVTASGVGRSPCWLTKKMRPLGSKHPPANSVSFVSVRQKS